MLLHPNTNTGNQGSEALKTSRVFGHGGKKSPRIWHAEKIYVPHERIWQNTYVLLVSVGERPTLDPYVQSHLTLFVSFVLLRQGRRALAHWLLRNRPYITWWALLFQGTFYLLIAAGFSLCYSSYKGVWRPKKASAALQIEQSISFRMVKFQPSN